MTATERPTAAELVKDHQAGIWRYLRYLGCTEAEADDLTQETFLAVIRKPFEYQGPAETAGCLRTVARRKFLMLLRKNRRAALEEQLELAESVWGEMSARARRAGEPSISTRSTSASNNSTAAPKRSSTDATAMTNRAKRSPHH